MAAANLPGWGNEGDITKQITDLLTYTEWNSVFTTIIPRLQRRDAQSMEDRMKEAKSFKDPYQKVKIVNRMIRKINEIDHELYMDQLVSLRGMRLTIVLPNSECDDRDFLDELDDLEDMEYLDLAVCHSWPIKKLKLLIDNHCGVPTEDQMLFHKSELLTNRNRNLNRNGIYDDSRLFMLSEESDFVVFAAETPDNPIPILNLTLQSDVRDLRIAIAHQFECQLPTLWYDGERLSDDRTLDSYDIGMGAMIEI